MGNFLYPFKRKKMIFTAREKKNILMKKNLK